MSRDRQVKVGVVKQEELPFGEEKTWGGARVGAGRKRRLEKGRVPHGPREEHERAHPVHVVWKLREGLPSLRRRAEVRVIRGCFRGGKARFGFRLVHYSLQTNHVHMLVEAEGQGSLSRGMNGLGVRLARQLNKLWGRRGWVFRARYFKRELENPTVVRRALLYVLQNHRRHGARWTGPDPFSSAPLFRGWKRPCSVREAFSSRLTGGPGVGKTI